MQFVKRTFENGLRTVVAPMSGTDTVTILVLVGTGSNYEERKESGLSHFLEHMFFKGTKNHPKPGELDRMLDAVGAVHNAFTSREETGYWIKVDARHFPLALTFVSDILQNALLKEEEVNRERGVILEEMKMYWDTPRRYIWSLFEELVYGDNSYGWDVLGTARNIRTIKRSQFINYWKSQYTAQNTVVVVAGNISASTVFPRIESAFSQLRTGKARKAPALKKVAHGPRIKLFEKETDQSHVVLGAIGYELEHKDQYAASILATILGGYMSSRLWADIRNRHGLAYVVSAMHTPYRVTGYFATYTGVPHERREEVVKRIVGHLERIRRSGATTEELHRAKENTKGHLALSLESTDEVAAFLGGQEILTGKIKTPAEVVKKVDKVSLGDIQRVARTIFRKDNIYLAMIGPRLSEATYHKILASSL